MKSILRVSSVVALALASTAHAAQSHPDFSGTWRMDPTRSASAVQGEPVGLVTVVITQTPSEIRIDTTTSRGKTSEAYRFAAAEAGVAGSLRVARWNGDTLVTDAVRDVRGQSVTTQQSRRLNADGSEMTVESIVAVQHGYTLSGAKNYGAGKDVFLKQRP